MILQIVVVSIIFLPTVLITIAEVVNTVKEKELDKIKYSDK